MRQIIFQSLYGILWAFYFLWVYVFFGESRLLSYLGKSWVGAEILSISLAIAAFFICTSIFTLFQYGTRRALTRLAKSTKTNIDDIAVEVVFESIHYIKYIIASYVAWHFVKLPQNITDIGDKVLYVVLIFIVSLYLSRITKIVLEKWIFRTRRMPKMSKAIINFLEKVIIAFIWVAGVITALSSLGYNISALIAGAGVSGIAIALAAQKSVANIFGAVTILLNKPLEIWDYVTIEGTTGTVRDIGLTYITLTDRLGHEVSIPNETIISSSIQNESRRAYRRADFSLGLVYETTLKQMEKWVEIVEAILQSYVDSKILQSYRVNFEAFWDFSLNINVTYFTNTSVYNDFVKEKEQINLQIKKDFAKAKLEMAFPTTEMIIKKWDI